MIQLNLRKILFEKNISQKKLSDMTGIHTSIINLYVRNRIDYVKLDFLEKICDALGCSYNDVIVKVPESKV